MEKNPIIAVEPAPLAVKLFVAACVLACVALAFSGCARFEKRRPHEELTDCLYHARFDFGMSEPERQEVERGCRAVYDMRQRERLQ